jgi:hypothetical protein
MYLKLIVGYCLHPLLTVEGSLNTLDIQEEEVKPPFHPNAGAALPGIFSVNEWHTGRLFGPSYTRFLFCGH